MNDLQNETRQKIFHYRLVTINYAYLYKDVLVKPTVY